MLCAVRGLATPRTDHPKQSELDFRKTKTFLTLRETNSLVLFSTGTDLNVGGGGGIKQKINMALVYSNWRGKRIQAALLVPLWAEDAETFLKTNFHP